MSVQNRHLINFLAHFSLLKLFSAQNAYFLPNFCKIFTLDLKTVLVVEAAIEPPDVAPVALTLVGGSGCPGASHHVVSDVRQFSLGILTEVSLVSQSFLAALANHCWIITRGQIIISVVVFLDQTEVIIRNVFKVLGFH